VMIVGCVCETAAKPQRGRLAILQSLRPSLSGRTHPVRTDLNILAQDRVPDLAVRTPK
jgi:hypothetical protein